ncbi:hypothetical protein PTKIN_Ptkin09bG0290300 [Pterospermum kingtungense]
MMGLKPFSCFITVIFIYAMLISQAYCARVRLLDGFSELPASDNVVTTEPVHNLVLGHQNFQVLPSTAGYMSPDSNQGPQFRSLVLNLLPKGKLPPSGPSKRTNTIAN